MIRGTARSRDDGGTPPRWCPASTARRRVGRTRTRGLGSRRRRGASPPAAGDDGSVGERRSPGRGRRLGDRARFSGDGGGAAVPVWTRPARTSRTPVSRSAASHGSAHASERRSPGQARTWNVDDAASRPASRGTRRAGPASRCAALPALRSSSGGRRPGRPGRRGRTPFLAASFSAFRMREWTYRDRARLATGRGIAA